MTILITGATSGIGLATATVLAKQGRDVALVGRSAGSAMAAAASVRRETDALVSHYAADLAYRDQVVALARAVTADHPTIDGLVLCAAVSHPTQAVTEGIDTTLAVNHLAPVLLARLLDKSGGDGRIVLVASSQHVTAGAFDPATFDADSPASAMRRYETTKLLNLLFASARLRRPHVASMEVVDPGFVHTRLGRNARGALRIMLTLTRPFQTSPDVAARLIADRLGAPDFRDGAYNGAEGTAKRAANARDQDAADRAWEWTNDLLVRPLLNRKEMP